MSTNDFPLVNRYQAAWNEQAVRTNQRVMVLQIYLVASATLFGFWVTHTSKSPSDNSLELLKIRAAATEAEVQLLQAKSAVRASKLACAPRQTCATPKDTCCCSQLKQAACTSSPDEFGIQLDAALGRLDQVKADILTREQFEKELKQNPKKDLAAVQIAELLAWGETLLTLVCTFVVWHVNDVIAKLTDFMKECEHAMKNTIIGQVPPDIVADLSKSETDRASRKLFRFYDGISDHPVPGKGIDPFHIRHRLLNRIIFFMIFAAANTLAIYLASDLIAEIDLVFCLLFLLIALTFLMWEEVRSLLAG